MGKDTEAEALDFDVLANNVGVQVHLTRRALWLRAGRIQPKARGNKPSGYITSFIVIGANPGVSQKRLADELFLDANAVGDIVDILEKEGLVERRRDPADRRRHNLFLTDKGHSVWQELRAGSDERDRAVTASLSAAEVATLIALLKRLRA